MRFFGAADRVAYTSCVRGAKEEAKGIEPLDCSSGCASLKRPQGSGLNSKLATAHELATCGARCNSTWLKIRSPAGFDRCNATSRDQAPRHFPKRPSMPSRNSPLPPPPAYNDRRPTRSNDDVHEKIACGINAIVNRLSLELGCWS